MIEESTTSNGRVEVNIFMDNVAVRSNFNVGRSHPVRRRQRKLTLFACHVPDIVRDT
jgi:hypothetical protein